MILNMLKQVINQKWEFSPDYFTRSSKILDTALTQVAVYRSWKTLDPGPVYPVDIRFAALPALTKKDIRENFPQGLIPVERDINQGIVSGEIQLVYSTGTADDKVTNI